MVGDLSLFQSFLVEAGALLPESAVELVLLPLSLAFEPLSEVALDPDDSADAGLRA